MLAQLLAKLYIPEEVDDVKLRWILTLITKLKDVRLASSLDFLFLLPTLH